MPHVGKGLRPLTVDEDSINDDIHPCRRNEEHDAIRCVTAVIVYQACTRIVEGSKVAKVNLLGAHWHVLGIALQVGHHFVVIRPTQTGHQAIVIQIGTPPIVRRASIAAIGKQHRARLHQHDQRIFIRMSVMRHLFEGIELLVLILPLIAAIRSGVTVVQQAIACRIPAVLSAVITEGNLLGHEIVDDLFGRLQLVLRCCGWWNLRQPPQRRCQTVESIPRVQASL